MGILYLVAITNGSLSIIVAGPTLTEKFLNQNYRGKHSKARISFFFHSMIKLMNVGWTQLI